MRHPIHGPITSFGTGVHRTEFFFVVRRGRPSLFFFLAHKFFRPSIVKTQPLNRGAMPPALLEHATFGLGNLRSIQLSYRGVSQPQTITSASVRSNLAEAA